MRSWKTDASPEADTRIGRVGRWAFNRGWLWLANLCARWRT